MSKHSSALVLTLAASVLLTACAHQRQPKARCTGPLERINVAALARPADSRVDTPTASHEGPRDEERAP